MASRLPLTVAADPQKCFQGEKTLGADETKRYHLSHGSVGELGSRLSRLAWISARRSNPGSTCISVDARDRGAHHEEQRGMGIVSAAFGVGPEEAAAAAATYDPLLRRNPSNLLVRTRYCWVIILVSSAVGCTMKSPVTSRTTLCNAPVKTKGAS